MIPPPITSRRSGTSSRSSAPVEVITRSSSSGRLGIVAEREPAAMIAWRKATEVVPSAVSTSSVWAPVNVPSPVNTWTFLCLARPARPPVSFSTAPDLKSRTPSRSIDGSPKSRPWAFESAASAMTLAMWSSALEGMQPTLRQTPPSRS